MVVDTSALIAMLMNEPEAASFSALVFSEPVVRIGAPTRFEFLMAAGGDSILSLRPSALDEAEAFLSAAHLEVVSFDDEHTTLANAAFRRFGKGSGHRAQLNFGDCMSYALARALDVPLLYKGQGFAMTDIRSAA